ncbi:MAG: flavodoxin family protein [Anaerolineales bacterium]|jgi:multimeric flavodoxin WrbA
MSKNILILKGSPREKGNSATLAAQVFAGAKQAGASVEDIYLHGMDIRPCDHCDFCQEGDVSCVIKDDMQTLYPKLRQADAIVITCPIYWFTMSAQMKLCIDRWYAFETSQGSALKGKQLGIILTYGGTDLYTSGGINAIHTFESMARYLKLDIVGIVHGSAMNLGDMEKQPELLERAYQLGQKLAS